MFKKPHYIAVGLVVLLALVLLNLPERAAARLKLAIGSFFLPLFGLASGAQQTSSAAAEALTPRRELLRQNEALRQENERLRILAGQSAEIARQNAALRQQIGWQKQTQWNLKPAQVVSRDPANWWRTVQINVGSLEGVRENLAVLTPDGLVGKISSVSVDRAQVVLLGDPNCRVSAVVENTARDQGIVGVAGGPFDGSMLELDFLPRSAAIKPSLRVVTSGEGGIFPKGIPVGVITESHLAENGLFTQGHLKLSANLGALEEVWVLFP